MAALYFLVPLYSTLQFSLETGPHSYGFKWYSQIFADPMFRTSFLFRCGTWVGEDLRVPLEAAGPVSRLNCRVE